MPFELRPSGWDLVTYRLELAQDLWADILTSFIPARKNDEAFVDQLRRYQFCLDKRPVKNILHTPEIDISDLKFTKWGSQQSMCKHGSSRDVIGQPTQLESALAFHQIMTQSIFFKNDLKTGKIHPKVFIDLFREIACSTGQTKFIKIDYNF